MSRDRRERVGRSAPAYRVRSRAPKKLARTPRAPANLSDSKRLPNKRVGRPEHRYRAATWRCAAGPAFARARSRVDSRHRRARRGDIMKMVQAIVEPFKLDAVKDAIGEV